MEHSQADEPLLANDGTRFDDASDEAPETSIKGLGGLFIWALTLAAGISGLLFGYEYGIIQPNLQQVL